MELLLALLLAGVKAAPPFLEEPSNGSVALGKEAELRCAVRGGVAVQWARRGLLLGALPGPAHPRYRLVGDARKGEHHLHITAAQLEDDGVWQCQAGGGNGTAGSRPALLRVMVPPARPELELPEGAELPWREGAELEVRCRVGGARPAANLRLALGGEPLPEVSSHVSEDGSDPRLSTTQVTVRVAPRRSSHLQTLLCSAANEAGGAPKEARLTVSVLFPPEPPAIEGLESPQVRLGDTLRLQCVARGGNPPPSLHWEKNGVPLPSPWFSDSPLGGAAALSRSRLVLAVTRLDDGATLRCRSRSEAGGGGSASVTISVRYLPSELTISGVPSVAENGSLSLSCTSAPSNPPVRLRWWLGGRELQHGDTAVTPAEGGGSISVSNVTLVGRRADHGRALLCEALSPGLGSRSASVLLGVTHPPQEVWLEAPPPNATFRAGARVRLLCHARGGHPAPRLVWTRDGRPLKDGQPQVGGAVTTRELQVVLTPSDNGAVYGCEVGGLRGGPAARTRLSVLFPPQSVSISVSPPSPRPGSSVELSCSAGSARPAPTLRWELRGTTQAGSALPPLPAPFGGVQSRSVLRLQVTAEDAGLRVACRASTGRLGVTVSAEQRLQLRHPPLVSLGAAAVVVREGGVAELPAAVRAHPPPESCVWSRDGTELRAAEGARLRLRGAALLVANATRGDAGLYRLSCSNAEGSGSAALRLSVHYPPRILRAPDPVLVDEGGAAELQCEAEGSPMGPGSLQWARLQEAAYGAVPGPLPPELQVLGSGPRGRLRVAAARRGLAGPYQCLADNGVGPPARGIVRLVVRYGPELEEDPAVVAVPDGAEVAELRCRARGVPPVELSWEHYGQSLPPDGERYRWRQWREAPWSGSVLTVSNVSLERSQRRAAPAPNWDQYPNWEPRNRTLGSFVCVARSARGSARREMRLQLADRPDPPRDVRVLQSRPTALSLEWRAGFGGGLQQSFIVRVQGPGAPPPPAAFLAPGPALTVSGLRPSTTYDVTVIARNARGDSAPVSITATTSDLPQDWPQPPGEAPPPSALPIPPALVGALCAVGALLLVGNGVLGGALLRRNRKWGGGAEESGRSQEGRGEESVEMSSVGSWPPLPPSAAAAPPTWEDFPPPSLEDLHKWGPPAPPPGQLHHYEDVLEWGGGEEVPFDLRGELV